MLPMAALLPQRLLEGWRRGLGGISVPERMSTSLPSGIRPLTRDGTGTCFLLPTRTCILQVYNMLHANFLAEATMHVVPRGPRAIMVYVGNEMEFRAIGDRGRGCRRLMVF